MLTVELHAHSVASYDGRDTVEAILQHAASADLDAIAITDHDEFDASRRAVDIAPNYNLVAIPGMEVSSADGHVLALGIEEEIPAGLSFEETLSRIHEQGGLSIVPHPFQELRSGVIANIDRDTLARAEAIEVYNSRLLTGRSNRQASRFASERGLPVTAGSDAHISEMVGQAVTEVDPEEATPEAILEEIREGRTVIDGHRTPLTISARQTAAAIRRRVSHRLGTLTD